MNIDPEELAIAIKISLPQLQEERQRLQLTRIGMPLAQRAVVSRQIDELRAREVLLVSILSNLNAAQNSIGELSVQDQQGLDKLAQHLDTAIITNARINAGLKTAIALADAIKSNVAS